MKSIVAAAALSLSIVSAAAADTLIMRDGTRAQGSVVNIEARTVIFRHVDGVARRYPTSDIQAVEFPMPERAYPRATGGRRFEAPSGTQLVVRTVERIDSRAAGPDQIFSAIFEEQVTTPTGAVMIPVGASAQLLIRDVSSGGATGSPELVLDIQSITVDGRRYVVSTTDLVVDSGSGIGANKRTAGTVGGGAAIGTIIGAIAGGGKGAVIGGVIGAGGGVAAQVLTKGHDVQVPAETVLQFRLDMPVMLRAEQ